MTVRIAPSILAADFTKLGSEIEAAERGGADWVHVDVMDGHFVPNISMGSAITAAAKRVSDLPLDVHLMVSDPDPFLESFVESGASWLTVHQEACIHLHRTVERIRSLGVRPGVAINPATSVELLAPIIPYIDLIVMMTVNPGFGGQSFIAGSLQRVKRVRELADSLDRADILVEVDGGIDSSNVASVARAGADTFVAGSAVFRHPEGAEAGVRALRAALASGEG